MKTKVKFLIDKSDDVNDRTVFAIFTDSIHDKYNKHLFTSYAHIGQHSACHIDYANECELAKFDEYQDLKRELEILGYKLDVLNEEQKEIEWLIATYAETCKKIDKIMIEVFAGKYKGNYLNDIKDLFDYSKQSKLTSNNKNQ